MKRLLIAAALAVTTLPAFAGDVGISVSVGQPGYYGRLDLGYPQPELIYRRPIAVERVPYGRQPIYLHVPGDHARNWRQHCGEYSACDERVYFVRDQWYDREYVPRYRRHHGDRHDQRGDERNYDHRGGDGSGDRRGDSQSGGRER